MLGIRGLGRRMAFLEKMTSYLENRTNNMIGTMAKYPELAGWKTVLSDTVKRLDAIDPEILSRTLKENVDLHSRITVLEEKQPIALDYVKELRAYFGAREERLTKLIIELQIQVRNSEVRFRDLESKTGISR